jgi:hypothetical protein
MNWWCAPTLRQAKIAFNYIGRWLPPGRYKVNRTEMAYYLLRSDGTVHATIEFRSADNPDSLRGEGVDAAVVDEAGFWNRESFISVQTTLTQRRGKLRIISTPKGRNWFFDEWHKGWRGHADNPFKPNPNPDKEYASYSLPTSCNPTVHADAIEYARRNMPADSFRQEYLAEFLSESAGVFRNFEECATSQIYPKPMSGHRYAMGIDWAKHEDWTVFTVGDLATREVVYIERHTGLDWNSNIDRAIRTAKSWNNAAVLMDSTGVGDVPFDQMRQIYPNTSGYSISTNAAKKALIQKLQFAFERAQIGIPDKRAHRDEPARLKLAEELISELQTYSYKTTPGGVIQFSAPDGYHDDMVISLALLNWMFAEEPFVYKYRQVAGV